ncbi:zinc-binding dehydrogenase [Streptomyces oryzae]|uniref:zinc-binding dehydrogenase n=1 Tax=Streptomyces oryzae TaxID=1434886 RepID=UPI0027DB3409|nr:zinc-binding dehydrogenase [Streptomyces oryzae]
MQIAKARGARVVAVAGAAKHAAPREVGEDAVVARDAELPAALAAVGIEEVDVVADVVAGPSFGDLLGVLAPLGRYVVAGAIAGPLVETDLRTVYLRQLTLFGSSFGTHEDFAAVVDLVGRGMFRPLVAGRYPLAELATAQKHFVSKDFVGKLVVEP